MTVKRLLDKYSYEGLEADAKPIEGVPDGSTFLEIDTGFKSKFWEGSWYPAGLQLSDSEGNFIDANHPMSADGDSIYAKDINVTESDIGTFSGTITDLVDSLENSISDETSANPKWFKIKLQRPLSNTSIKFCAPLGTDFSNVKITLYDNAGTVVGGSDKSADDTKYTSNTYDWGLTPWCTALIEFYTADAVFINWFLAEKSQDVHALIQVAKPDGTVQDISYDNPLPIIDYDTEISFHPDGTVFIPVHKYGRNIAVGTTEEDIHGLGGLINWLQAATTVRIKAGGNAADTAGGAGARGVRIFGIDSNLNISYADLVTNGTSASAATSTLFWRPFALEVLGADSLGVGTYGGSNIGDIVLENGTGGTDLIRIAAGDGRSQFAAFSIPAAHYGVIKYSFLTVDSGKTANIKIYSRNNFNVVAAPMSPKILRAEFDGLAGPIPWKPPIKHRFEPLTDVWFSGSVPLTSAIISVNFCLELRPV